MDSVYSEHSKYNPQERVERNRYINELRHEKRMSLQDIADLFGLTRQRIYQITGASDVHAQVERAKKRREEVLSQPDKTNEQLAKELGVCEGTVLHVRSGTRYAAKRGCGVAKRQYADNKIAELLEQKGHTVELMPHRGEYNLCVDSKVRVSVRSAVPLNVKTNPNTISPQYKFRVDRWRRECDFFVLYMRDRDEFFVLPVDKIADYMELYVFCWPTLRPEISKVAKYLGALDLISEAANAKSNSDKDCD